jgi:hypothetical protein
MQCKVDLKKLTTENLECGSCTICQARSKLNYPFVRDLKTSNELVNAIKVYIEKNTEFKCNETTIQKNPDLCVVDIKHDDQLICRVEAKFLEGFAFMMAERYLGDHLKPKETLVVDEPKLLSYFECKTNDHRQQGHDIPIYVVWKFDRPCRDLGGITVFQEVLKLKAIYEARGNKRSFERKTVDTDIVAGVKQGITAKYHFSIKECLPIEELIPTIKGLA